MAQYCNVSITTISCDNADRGINQLLGRGKEFGFTDDVIKKLRKTRDTISEFLLKVNAQISNALIVIYIGDKEYNIKAGEGQTRVIVPFDEIILQKIQNACLETKTVTIREGSMTHVLGGTVGGAGLFGGATYIALMFMNPAAAIVGAAFMAGGGAGVGSIVGSLSGRRIEQIETSTKFNEIEDYQAYMSKAKPK